MCPDPAVAANTMVSAFVMPVAGTHSLQSIVPSALVRSVCPPSFGSTGSYRKETECASGGGPVVVVVVLVVVVVVLVVVTTLVLVVVGPVPVVVDTAVVVVVLLVMVLDVVVAVVVVVESVVVVVAQVWQTIPVQPGGQRQNMPLQVITH